MKTALRILGAILFVGLLAGCPRWTGPYPPGAGKEAMTQYGTLDGLFLGLYDGDLTLGALRDYGDFGLGTFNGLDGEMVVLDGRIYQVAYDGGVHEKSCDTKTPFAALTFFDADLEVAVAAGLDYAGLQAAILAALPTPNLPHAIKLRGRFATLTTRSVPRQAPPYRPLTEVIQEQSEFDFEAINGTLVGYYLPAALNHLNAAGFHCHFISQDRQAGGHILALTTESGNVELDTLYTITALMPENTAFAEADLEGYAADTEGVEKSLAAF